MAKSNFDRLASSLGGQKGIKNPDALAAWIGNQKFGKGTMQKAAAKGVPAAKIKSKQNVKSHGQPTIRLPAK